MLQEINQWPHEVYIIFIYFNYYLYSRSRVCVYRYLCFSALSVLFNVYECVWYKYDRKTKRIALDARETNGWNAAKFGNEGKRRGTSCCRNDRNKSWSRERERHVGVTN